MCIFRVICKKMGFLCCRESLAGSANMVRSYCDFSQNYNDTRWCQKRQKPSSSAGDAERCNDDLMPSSELRPYVRLRLWKRTIKFEKKVIHALTYVWHIRPLDRCCDYTCPLWTLWCRPKSLARVHFPVRPVPKPVIQHIKSSIILLLFDNYIPDFCPTLSYSPLQSHQEVVNPTIGLTNFAGQ